MKVSPQDLKIIKDILSKHTKGCKVLAFGSRVHGENLKKFSDLDLAIEKTSNFSDIDKANLRNEFSNSNLTYKVDLVFMDEISPEFKSYILMQFEEIIFS